MKTWFENKDISFRILTGFILLLLIAASIGATGIINLQRTNGRYRDSYQDSVAGMEKLETISSSFQRMLLNMYGVILVDGQKDKALFTERMEALKDEVEKNVTEYYTTLNSYDPDAVKDLLANIIDTQNKLEVYYQEVNKYMGEFAQNTSRRAEAALFLSEDGLLRDLALEIDDNIRYSIQLEKVLVDHEVSGNERTLAFAIITMIITIAIGVLLAVFIGLYISRDISSNIQHILVAADQIALGDVGANIEVNRKDEIGRLAQSFWAMISNIREQALMVEKVADGDLTVDVTVHSDKDLLGQKLYELVTKNNEALSNIKQASNQVAVGAQQISDTSMSLSQGATEQASSVEELSATINEISEQVKQNADNARNARTQSQLTGEEVEESNRQMQKLIKAIDEINSKSTEIGKIIKTIDDIAFQTNILALNAAVEAARAGAAGKGFAVVADEVRNLAGKSAEAAKDTTQLIEETIQAVEQGTDLAGETAKAMELVVQDTIKVSGLIDEIAQSSNAQADAISQITSGIDQISTVVQGNSATSEESAATAEELSGQAQMLNHQISKFRLSQVAEEAGSRQKEEKNNDVINLSMTNKSSGFTLLGKY